MQYGGILLARVNSTRLPAKVLLKLGDEAVLEFLIKRLRHCQRVQRWIVATSTARADDEVAALAKRLRVEVFRGSLADVLDRLYRCAVTFGIEHVVRLGADNPLIDPAVVDNTIAAFERAPQSWDYFSNHHPPSFPDGEEVEIIPFAALQRAWCEAKAPHEREHGTPYLWDQPQLFRIGNYARSGEVLYYQHRWTLDYPEDYQFLCAVRQAFAGSYDFSESQIVDFLDQHGEIYQINRARHGDTWHARERDKIRTLDHYRQISDPEFARSLGSAKRRICCITGSRAEYSRLRPVLAALKRQPAVELQIVCTGTHLLERYGNSIDDLTRDGFEIAATCFMLVEGETPITMSKSIGLGIIEFSNILANLKPDILLVMGDRFEAIASALSGVAMNIVVAHIQGGELSGSLDGSLRHAITKLAHLHFPATALSRERIIAMGEDPGTVFNVGCPAVDTLLSTPLLSVEDLLRHPLIAPQQGQRFRPREGYVLCAFHPVTTEYDRMAQETKELMVALDQLGENVFWVWPNADAGARKIVRAVDQHLAKSGRERFEFFDHVPMELFISLMARAKLMVGNSSAGIREACYFGAPVVNVGTRQRLRERAPNVLDAPGSDADSLLAAMRAQLAHGRYPKYQLYGRGDSGRQIAEILGNIKITSVQKSYHEPPLSHPAAIAMGGRI